MNTNGTIQNMIDEGRRFFGEKKQRFAEAENQYRQFWRQTAGPLVDSMLENRGNAENSLESPEPNVRCAALSILCDVWKAASDPNFVRSCERMALQDADFEVRSMALTCLGCCLNNSGDRRIGKLFAEIVSDAALPDDVRIAAYSSLFALCGELDSHLELFLDFRFPENVDWKMVEAFATGSPPPTKVSDDFVFPAIPLQNERFEDVR